MTNTLHDLNWKPDTLNGMKKQPADEKIDWRLVVCLFVLFREEEKDTEMSCYYCKLRGADTVNVDINVGQGDFNDSREPRAHVLCFLTPHSNMLDQYPWNFTPLTSVTCNICDFINLYWIIILLSAIVYSVLWFVGLFVSSIGTTVK